MWLRTHVVSCGVVALVVSAASASAQSAPNPQSAGDPLAQLATLAAAGPPLALRDAVDEALRNNADLTALRRAADAAATRPAAARFLPPPMLEAQIWEWPVNTLNPAKAGGYMVSLGQDLPGKGKREREAAVMSADARMTANDVEVRAQQVASDVARAYADLATARLAAAVYAEIAVWLRQTADAAEARYANGRAPQQDALKALVELSRVYDAGLEIESQAEIAAARLNALLGRSPAAPIGALDDAGAPAPLPDPASLQELALTRHPEIAGAKLAIERANAGVAAAKGGEKPDFTVRGGYMLMPQGVDAWVASVAMTWPNAPWSRGRVDAKVAEELAGVSAARAQLDAVQRARALAVQEAWVRARTATTRLALIDTTVLPQAEQSLASARIGYESGRAEFAALLDAERMLLDERLARVRAQGDYLLARADLDLAVGGR